ncbi:MAG: L-threonylcarbamoyladenylate synthase [Acidimicrobiales bacterium]|jgi:L-threonylcarbamoyladenylate synthase|nr:L-threonylcarbamoyladenylate synthase [Acidimicrobiales bacterium]
MTPTDLDDAAQAMRAGDVVVIPTDTVYGLAAAADNSAGVEAMFRLKNRPVDVNVAVLVADADQARQYVDLGPAGEALADRYWPGPLTIVAVRHAVGSLAAGDDETLGVRCPDEAVARALAERVGPVAATSANLHGQDTPGRADAVADLFPDVSVVIDDGARPGAASTVVSVVDGVAVVLREGPISAADIDAVIEADS